jgi:MFS family permease
MATFKHLQKTYQSYPQQFWILIAALFIDRVGGALIFPFLTLYITKKFGVGMTEVGLIFGLFSIANVVGSVASGALTDRIGRKKILIAGLIISALTHLSMGLVNSFNLFFGAAALVGLFANLGGPAQHAMVADLLPEEKRAEGFGILRIAANLAVTIGPAIGGLLASRSYMLLFVSDAVFSTLTALIVWVALRETKPPTSAENPTETLAQTFGGYGKVLHDRIFMYFIGASILMVLVYMQMNTTLSVYLRDMHGVSEQGFGYIMSLNAAMVVLFQFTITRWTVSHRPLSLMVAGTLLYAFGFAMYGFVSQYGFFLLAMAIITIGEMLSAPTSQALVAQFAPEEMRGRYMAVFDFSWVIPSAIGPLLAGILMDNADPRTLWYAAGLVGVIAAGAFALLQRNWNYSNATVTA